ncbi:MAG TPA: hypothetical protein DEG09_13335 [Marinilabiliaceae bacterium]|nr:hypothetical protein [Marinilabiliaceae bacterium]
MNPILIFLMLFPFLLNSFSTDAQTTKPTDWERKWEMKPGIFRVLKEGQVGLIDSDMRVLIPCQYDQVYDLDEEQYVKVIKDLKIGLYHLEHGMILPAEYDQIWPFEDGMAKVMKNKKFGYVDKTGAIIIPAIYTQIGAFENDIALAVLDGEKLYLDKKGKLLADPPEEDRPSQQEALQSDSTIIEDTKRAIIKIGPEQINNDNTYKREITINTDYRWECKKKNAKFDGHLSTFNLGINGFLDKDMRENLPPNYDFMSTIHEKSIEVGVFPFQHAFRLIGNNIGLVSSLGLKFNNYRFNIERLSDIPEESRPWFPLISEEADISKSKLSTINLSLPLVLEFQIPNGKDKFYISGGVEGNLRLRSHVKLVYREEGDSEKRKKRDDFGLNGFRYDFIARAGYKNFGIYASYSPVSLFRSNKGPEIYPYTVGLTFKLD